MHSSSYSMCLWDDKCVLTVMHHSLIYHLSLRKSEDWLRARFVAGLVLDSVRKVV